MTPGRASRGLAFYRNGNHARATEKLSSSLPATPGRSRRRGAVAHRESYYASANFAQAVVEYRKLVDKYPARTSSQRPLRARREYYELDYRSMPELSRRLVAEYPGRPRPSRPSLSSSSFAAQTLSLERPLTPMTRGD